MTARPALPLAFDAQYANAKLMSCEGLADILHGLAQNAVENLEGSRDDNDEKLCTWADGIALFGGAWWLVAAVASER